MYTVYNMDGTKRTEWTTKANAISAARALKKQGIATYAVNEKNAEIIWKAEDLA